MFPIFLSHPDTQAEAAIAQVPFESLICAPTCLFAPVLLWEMGPQWADSSCDGPESSLSSVLFGFPATDSVLHCGHADKLYHVA